MRKICGRKHEAMAVSNCTQCDSVHILATALSNPQNARASALSPLSLLGYEQNHNACASFQI